MPEPPTWLDFETFLDRASAEFLAGLLENEGIPTQVLATKPLPGMEGFVVQVAGDQVRRAQWVLENLPEVDEAELTRLATGEDVVPLEEDEPEFVAGPDPTGFRGDPPELKRHRRAALRRKKRRS